MSFTSDYQVYTATMAAEWRAMPPKEKEFFKKLREDKELFDAVLKGSGSQVRKLLSSASRKKEFNVDNRDTITKLAEYYAKKVSGTPGP